MPGPLVPGMYAFGIETGRGESFLLAAAVAFEAGTQAAMTKRLIPHQRQVPRKATSRYSAASA